MIYTDFVRGRRIVCPSRSTLRKWKMMTNQNLHPEVRILIAKYFGDRARLKALEKILMYSESGGLACFCLGDGYDLSHLMTDITYGLIRDIEYVFGEEVADKVWRCL